MNLAILTTTTTEEPFSPALLDFARIAADLGHPCRLVRHGEILFALTGPDGQDIIAGPGVDALREADLVIPKISLRVQCRGDFYLLDSLARRGKKLLQGVETLECCRNKVTSLERLARAGIPVPPTMVVRRKEQLSHARQLIGNAPWIVKPSMGSQGRDILLAATDGDLEDAVERLWETDRHALLLVQPFLPAPGREHWDIRAFVLRRTVLGLMRREAAPGEHRSNFSLGGRVSLLAPDPALEALALRAADVVGAAMAGVDILVSPRGPVVLEVNANPGWEGISQAMGDAGDSFPRQFIRILETSVEGAALRSDAILSGRVKSGRGSC